MDPQIVVEDVNRALQADELPRAIDMAQRAVADGTRHPLLFNLAAHGLELRHDYDGAIALLEQGLTLAPDDVDMLTALGLCQNKLGRAPQAQAAFDAVLSARPDFAPAHHGKGTALERLGDLDGARRHHATAMHLMPGYADPIGSLASLAARASDTENARALAMRALAIDPNQVNARVVMAGITLGERDHAGAEAASRALIADPSIDPLDRALCEIMLGDALDGQGRVDEAYADYVAGKADFRRVHARQYEGPGVESYTDFARRVGDGFEKLPECDWHPQGSGDGPARTHVFLLGFFRSGTTLLENVLAGHPDVAALDERDTLRSAMAEFLADDAGLNRLAALTPELATAQRDVYWHRVRDFGVDPNDKVFVDKMP
ncbi:MAG: tetratricopeptide repeat protein, partial [Casimicrobiaceae bacterium]